MTVHVETIGLQKNKVRMSLECILPRISKDHHSAIIRLFPILTYLVDINMTTRLKQVAIKHIQISSKIKAYEMGSHHNFDNPLCPELNLLKTISYRNY